MPRQASSPFHGLQETVLIRSAFLTLAAATLGLSALAVPAHAAPAASAAPASPVTSAAPATASGCTTSIEWVTEGSDYYYGRGNIQCATGRYRAKNVCHNLQTGEGYVVYGTQVVNAPATATVTCHTGNVAESVLAVDDPPAAGVTGCATWIEWVTEGSDYYYGRGRLQCDTGRYKADTFCHNMQTGEDYVVHGTQVVNAPDVATTTCNTGNVAQSVQAVPQ